MTWWQAALLLLAGLAAGTINTVVGSGTLITFPTLLALGYPPVTANVSNGIGLAIGGSTGVWGYRRELAGLRRPVTRLLPLSCGGAALGAGLLLWLPPSVFAGVVPVLIATSLVLVVMQPRIATSLRGRTREERSNPDGAADPDAADAVDAAGLGLSRRRWRGVRAGVGAVGVYAGYFGAAQGVLLLGLLGSLLPLGLQPVNAVKNVLGTCANATAAVAFLLVAPEHVAWEVVVLLAAGSLVGGLVGAGIGRRLPAPALRVVIVLVGTAALVSLVTR